MRKIIPLIIIFGLISVAIVLMNSTIHLLSKQNLLTENACNEINYEDQKKISRENLQEFLIKISIQEERKWKINIISDQIKSLQNKWNFNAFERNRDRVKAKIYLYLKDELLCYYDARIRAHGDLGDHRRGSELPSLNIHLSNGNLFGITKFILFRPVTRNYESEIFGANLLRELNFLSPRTVMVNVIYNDKKTKFIFQEKIVKEFIEELNFIENPLLEADERFVFKELASDNNFLSNEFRKLQKSKLVNKKIVLNDDAHLRNSILSLSILNEFKLKYFSKLSPYWILDFYSINNLIDKEKNYFKEVPSFDSLMYVMNGTHGLASDERRFYFDPIKENFHPIYYDGDFEIFDKNNSITSKFDTNILNKQMYNKVVPSFIIGSNEASIKLEKLNLEIFYNKLQKYGSKLNFEDVKKVIGILLIRLEKLNSLNDERVNKVFINQDKNYLNDLKFNSQIKRKIIFNSNSKDKFIICDIYGNNCENISLNSNQISNLLSQELKINGFDIVYTASKYLKSSLNDLDWERKNTPAFKSIKIENNKINFKIYGDVNFKFSEIKKEIFFEKNSIDGRIIFDNSIISNYDIYFIDNSVDAQKEVILKSFNGLNGCLNFFDTKFNEVNIYVNKSRCEDALNIIRSEGNLNRINIKDSISDGLDIDFSKFVINDLISINSKNDCADFSYGNYKIKKISIESCGDKGLSIGENSFFKNISLKANKIKIGIASKDSSKTSFQNVEIKNTDTCISAYNKKQEFGGGFIDIKTLKCNNFNQQIEVDKTSEVLIRNKF